LPTSLNLLHPFLLLFFLPRTSSFPLQFSLSPDFPNFSGLNIPSISTPVFFYFPFPRNYNCIRKPTGVSLGN
jgi:hypothetical protein